MKIGFFIMWGIFILLVMNLSSCWVVELNDIMLAKILPLGDDFAVIVLHVIGMLILACTLHVARQKNEKLAGLTRESSIMQLVLLIVTVVGSLFIIDIVVEFLTGYDTGLVGYVKVFFLDTVPGIIGGVTNSTSVTVTTVGG